MLGAWDEVCYGFEVGIALYPRSLVALVELGLTIILDSDGALRSLFYGCP